MPLLTILIVKIGEPAIMGRLMATVSVPMILGPLFGPIIGGIIMKYLTWQWIFWVNVPVVLISIALALWKIPQFPASNPSAKMDFVGIGLLITFSSTIIYALVEGAQQTNFLNRTSDISYLVGLVSLIAYIVWAHFRGSRAVLPLDLFKISSFNAAGIGLFMSGTVLNGAMLLLPLYFQNILHMTVLTAALSLLPQGIGMLISRGVVGRLTDDIGAKYVVMVSVVITFLGTIPFYWFTRDTSYWLMALALFVRGIGAGRIMMPLMTDSYTDMSPVQIAPATMTSKMSTLTNQLHAGHYHVAPTALAGFVQTKVAQLQLNAYQTGFLVVSLAALLIIVPTLFLTNKMNQH